MSWNAPTHPPVGDGRWLAAAPAWVVPLVVAVFQVMGTIGAARQQDDTVSLNALTFLLLLAGPALLVVRRRYPAAVLLGALAITLGYFALDNPHGPVFLALVVAFFSAVAGGYRLLSWVAGGVGYSLYLVIQWHLDDKGPPSGANAAGTAAWLLVVLVAAELVRIRGERVVEAAHTREEETRRRAGEERMRIARELHDVLAHNISLINVQAGVALHLLDDEPAQARTAMTAIKDASKDALRELRSVLGVLRQVDKAEPRTPAPGLGDLDGLVARAEGAGLTVRLERDGPVRSMPSDVDVAAFRIVQEALTNVTRHAGPATATVRIGYSERELTLQVDDDGPGTAAAGRARGAGQGITGMRERARALGGQLEAGPRPGGGFRVRARLPLDGWAGAG
ncbi:MAG TPA: sensor histidine kinase [Acidimicrobiia bacterium]